MKRNADTRHLLGTKHILRIAPNKLQRNLSPQAPNQVCSSDITYIANEEDSLQMMAVLNLFSREVAGWSMNHPVHTNAVINTWRTERFCRQPAPGLIFRWDRGSPFGSDGFNRWRKDNQLVPA